MKLVIALAAVAGLALWNAPAMAADHHHHHHHNNHHDNHHHHGDHWEWGSGFDFDIPRIVIEQDEPDDCVVVHHQTYCNAD